MTKIYLSQGGAVIIIPVPPAEITVNSPQKTATYETASQGDVLHIGKQGLKTWKWSSFFPAQKLSWAADSSMLGMEYVRAIEAMRQKREPILLSIPALGIAENTAIPGFEYSQRKGKDIHYSIELTEYRSWV